MKTNIGHTDSAAALFVTEYALVKLWTGLGIHHEAMIGRVIGELAAACLAGVFSLEDALAFVAARGAMDRNSRRPGESNPKHPPLSTRDSLFYIYGIHPANFIKRARGERLKKLKHRQFLYHLFLLRLVNNFLPIEWDLFA